MSDYIFDNRDVEEYDGDELDLDEIRLGDVIYLSDLQAVCGGHQYRYPQ